MSLQGLVKTFCEKPCFILSIGVRRSGKSYNSLALIHHAMKTGVFQQYILCLPVFDFEQTDSYDFIKKFQKAHPNSAAFSIVTHS